MRRIRSRCHLSFRQKLMLLVAGFVCLTSISLYAIAYEYTRYYLEAEAPGRYQDLNRKAIESMDRYFLTLQNAAITAGHNPDL